MLLKLDLQKQSNNTTSEGVIFDNFIGHGISRSEEQGAWLTSQEAAEFLRITQATLRNMTSNGNVPYYKLGRRNRYRKSDLVELLTSNMRGKIHGN